LHTLFLRFEDSERGHTVDCNCVYHLSRKTQQYSENHNKLEKSEGAAVTNPRNSTA
jgi:hypothetical protein